eukprot:CAMPEP_0195295546 /NCGR_PEP_ID=MMETSP0707-20130614/17608_1 /TAXON_ID=33640 /ORGANISM="Asterionellopsis glacialis, Strain CCMP134" /LENGTH=315 /DNA_ID=CAMNT_0040356795 /DNA_START=271 /DNA_END=1218 /DNA_ORIENTATION=+
MLDCSFVVAPSKFCNIFMQETPRRHKSEGSTRIAPLHVSLTEVNFPPKTRNTTPPQEENADELIINNDEEELCVVEGMYPSLTFLDEWYSRSATIKCPFFRRRAGDVIDGIAICAQTILQSSHPDLVSYIPPGCRDATKRGSKSDDDTNIEPEKTKTRGLDQAELYSIVLSDWKISNRKGYYITGRLTSSIYRDDCLFDGPDPDMPVKGVRKFVNAISQLFEYRTSTSKLLSLEWEGPTKLVAHWKLQGVLMLPWRPRFPSYTGKISYHFDEDGLIWLHEDEWDISVPQALLMTVWPYLGERLWKGISESIGICE